MIAYTVRVKSLLDNFLQTAKKLGFKALPTGFHIDNDSRQANFAFKTLMIFEIEPSPSIDLAEVHRLPSTFDFMGELID